MRKIKKSKGKVPRIIANKIVKNPTMPRKEHFGQSPSGH